MSIEYYNYDLRRSRMGAMFGDKVAIREEWVKRTRRYVVMQGLDLNALATFIKKGLYDRRCEGFNQKALDVPLSGAQQWVLTYIILSDFGVPDWLRDKEKDENVPAMVVAEPEEDDDTVAQALIKPAASMAEATTQATIDAGSATLNASKAVVGAAASIASVPVKSLAGLVRGTEAAANETIEAVDQAITEATETAPLDAEHPEATQADAQENSEDQVESVESGESGE
tara:strand:- start:18867 stop:19550 length:684 start_codon:yes stop_codon:yes gene_type:complete